MNPDVKAVHDMSVLVEMSDRTRDYSSGLWTSSVPTTLAPDWWDRAIASGRDPQEVEMYARLYGWRIPHPVTARTAVADRPGYLFAQVVNAFTWTAPFWCLVVIYFLQRAKTPQPAGGKGDSNSGK